MWVKTYKTQKSWLIGNFRLTLPHFIHGEWFKSSPESLNRARNGCFSHNTGIYLNFHQDVKQSHAKRGKEVENVSESQDITDIFTGHGVVSCSFSLLKCRAAVWNSWVPSWLDAEQSVVYQACFRLHNNETLRTNSGWSDSWNHHYMKQPNVLFLA